MLELLNFLNQVYPISPDAQQSISKVLRKKELRKNQVWLHEGSICDKIAFIQSGLLKVYFEAGLKEVCLWYNRENDIIISAKSFFKQTPSTLAIRAVTSANLYYVYFTELQSLYESHISFNANGRKILEHYYSLSEQHVSLLLLPAGMRYKLLTQLYPWMLTDKRITDSMLASYLGMTRASLYACKRNAA